MKKKVVFLSILFVIFGLFIFLRFFWLEAQRSIGRLEIVSSPTAGIFIDNVAVGRTPFDEDYKVGEYLLKLIPEGEASATASWQGKIKIYKNTRTYINRELGSSDLTSAGEIMTITKMEKKPNDRNNGEVYVESEPRGAIIDLDNDEKGVTSLLLEEVPKGDHELVVRLPGFFTRRIKINVEPGYRTNVVFKLALNQAQKTVSQLLEEEESKEASSESEAKKTTTAKSNLVVIAETPTGWLRVRRGPSINEEEITKVNPGEEYELLEESAGWFKIKLDDNREGWVSTEYATKK